jgi:phenylalanyl-tRNA synthetase beta subunit
MKISYKWLETYFDSPLPSSEKISELLTIHAFEVEGIESQNGDSILNIKVLPDRAHDALSHLGMAREVALLTGLQIKNEFIKQKVGVFPESNIARIEVENEKLFPRLTLLVIENVRVNESPVWLRERLDSIGQKSINNIVDATNFVMFEIGQPLHAYDVSKLAGEGDIKIGVRYANEGEILKTLDGKDLVLNKENVVIFDGNTENKKALGVAGIKGGEASKINSKTKTVVIEAANFDPVAIRLSSKSLDLRTDASVRFENGITPEYTASALSRVANIILDIASNTDTRVEGIADYYPRRANPYKVGVSLSEIQSVIGTQVSQNKVEEILQRRGYEWKLVTPREEIVSLAQKLIGMPYKFGSSVTYDSPRTFDCSSFVSYLFVQTGIALPRMTVDQFVYTEQVLESELQDGDLVFINSNDGKIHHESIEFMQGTPVPKGVDHNGIYAGEGSIIHGSPFHNKIVKENISEVVSRGRTLVGYRRVLGINEPHFVITIPAERLDLRIKEDLIEEIVRIYGYENIISKEIKTEEAVNIDKKSYYIEKIKNFFVSEGFSEIYSYSFKSRGVREVLNPIATNKAFLRENLADELKDVMKKNILNTDLLGLSKIKLFEIGTVFGATSENISLAFAISGKKDEAYIEKIKSALNDLLQSEVVYTEKGGVMEANIETPIERANGPLHPYAYKGSKNVKFKEYSVYPFIVRDLAVFVPNDLPKDALLDLIRKEAGELLVNLRLFDEFSKDGKVSYAYRLIFQSIDRTLTDEEVNSVMTKIVGAVTGMGWTVR